MKFKFFSTSLADAEIRSADAAINPLLDAAKITTIEVNGKPIPATSDDVPLALKISNLAATFKDGAGDKEMSEMIRNNTLLADQAKTFETRAVTAETKSETVARENVSLRAELQTQKDAVAKLTSENAEVITLRKAANTEAGRVTAELRAANAEISRQSLAFNCLSDLRGEDGNLLASTATADERQAAAERIPVADKIKSIGGAVNSAMAKTGVSFVDLPAAVPGVSQPGAGKPKALSATEQCRAAVEAGKQGKTPPPYQSPGKK